MVADSLGRDDVDGGFYEVGVEMAESKAGKACSGKG
jgi:hypothetical protein